MQDEKEDLFKASWQKFAGLSEADLHKELLNAAGKLIQREIELDSAALMILIVCRNQSKNRVLALENAEFREKVLQHI
jgi:hypothetical protein